MIVPGFIFNIIFAFGIPIHELSHYLMCTVCGTEVKAVKWWGLKEAYVVHDKPKRLYQTLLITIAPFVISNLIAVIFIMGARATSLFSFHIAIFLLWIGVSAAFFSFPSLHDSKNSIVEMRKFMDGELSKHKRELKKDKTVILKLFLDLVFLLFVFIPITLVLTIMVLFGYVVYLSLGWAYLVMLFMKVAPAIL